MVIVDINRLSAGNDTPGDEAIKEWVNYSHAIGENTNISVAIVDIDMIQQLNQRYRHKNSPTNVLSFPAEEDPVNGIRHLGDIVLCPEVIATEAREQGKSCRAHWAHMVIHGTLHLQNYDHIDPQDAEKMETLEIDILSKLGFANPY